ncbi:uncharacterized protein LOC126838796 isoform X2 [Adelges cooleyi]|nr:uncharacterized protein LOC126838796 isoform X2 [Adelges cooleyi]XP_050429464.1 uncharacterized protein LOC126838796 isoform X2 [Adelges cooleyi]XP_050429465.1 uncharacterized protein LOC126838796 isoform X2 [Adelges cooleyi]
MSQSKTSTSSPKSSKPADDSKAECSSPSSSKSGRSPSSAKSSPSSNKSLSIAERLAQSTRGKSTNPRSPVSKSPPSSPNAQSSSKVDIPKESSADHNIKSEQINGIDKNKVCNGSVDVKLEYGQLANGQNGAIIENSLNESNNIVAKTNCVKELENPKENGLIETKDNGTDKSDTGAINDEPTKPQRIDDSVIMELKSKKDIRQKVWEFLEENSLVVFPKPCFNRIPNFKGCIDATQTLEKLDDFKKAKTVQVTPDKAQETARFLTLNWGKRLLVPLLRLKEGLLQCVSLPFAEPSAKMLRSASTQKGLRKWGNKLITLDQNNENDVHHIDMIILGSVAVDKKGRRIGIGNGFCDLEFVILNSMNMVTENTVIVTVVHDAQVFDNLPADIFMPYDVPVDIIITPHEIIRVENRIERPKDVFWNYISKRRLLEMPPLQLLRTKQEADSKIDCTLKDVDSDPEEIPPSPKTYKRTKSFRHRRSYSTRSETNDSVFKDSEVSKRRSVSRQRSASTKDSRANNKRNKSASSQQRRSSSAGRRNNEKERRSSSKKPNKRRAKSESAKTGSPETDSKNSNGQQGESPITTPKNKRRQRPKPRRRIHADDDKQSVRQSVSKIQGNNKRNSRSNSRNARQEYVERQDYSRDISTGRKARREYIPSPKQYYSRHDSYSQERQPRNNSRVTRRDLSNRPVVMQQNRYSNGPVVRPTRYFNGSMVRQHSFNAPVSRQNSSNSQILRHNSFSNDPLSRQNSFYDGSISRRNSFSKGAVIRQEGYTNTRVFRPPQYRNGMSPQANEDQREYRGARFNNNRVGYYNSNERPNYSRTINADEFVLKVGNIANNVRVRDLKAALMDRGVKPLHITWRGPRGFAYLRYTNSEDVNKDNIIGSLQNVRIKPNGVETAQTQTLIVTEC